MSDDKSTHLLKQIARHAKGLAHAAEALADLRESTKSDSAPKSEPTRGTKDETS